MKTYMTFCGVFMLLLLVSAPPVVAEDSSDCSECHDELFVADSGHHPVDIFYDTFNPMLRPKSEIPAELVLTGGYVTCTTCHSPEYKVYEHVGGQLVIDNSGSALCSACHPM